MPREIRPHFVVRVYILTDSNGEWWEIVARGGDVSLWSHSKPSKEFASVKAAKAYAKKRVFKRYQVLHLTPPVPPRREWQTEVVEEVSNV